MEPSLFYCKHRIFFFFFLFVFRILTESEGAPLEKHRIRAITSRPLYPFFVPLQPTSLA